MAHGETAGHSARDQPGCRHCPLAPLCLPCGLDPRERDQLSALVRPRHLQREEILYQPGAPLRTFAAVRRGGLKAVLWSAQGRAQILGLYFPGALVGLDALHSRRYTCASVALEMTWICEFPAGQLEELSQRVPTLQQRIRYRASRQIGARYVLLGWLGRKTGEQRLACFLAELARDRQTEQARIGTVRLPMARQELADYLGVTPVTISRLLTRFQDQGVLQVQGRWIQILAFERLRALARGSECMGLRDLHPE